VAAALVVAAGCSDDDDGDQASPTTERSTTTTERSTTSSTSTTAPPSTSTSTTTSPTAALQFPSDADDYTARLVRAWGRGDRAAAEQYAAAAVVDQLFGYADPGGSRWDLTSPCEGAGGTTYCSYEDPERGAFAVFGIPVANGNRIDGPHEVASVRIEEHDAAG